MGASYSGHDLEILMDFCCGTTQIFVQTRRFIKMKESIYDLGSAMLSGKRKTHPELGNSPKLGTFVLCPLF